MNAVQEQFRYSVERCIREHIAQDADFDNAVREASREIVEGLIRPICAPGHGVETNDR